jgi:hypothetical protein
MKINQSLYESLRLGQNSGTMYLNKKMSELSIGKQYDFFRMFRVEIYSALAKAPPLPQKIYFFLLALDDSQKARICKLIL